MHENIFIDKVGYMRKKLLILYGPTGVGKTEISLLLAQELAQELPVEIINGDMGQCYTKLSMGTAKPDWRKQLVPHHLFDCVDNPENFSVVAYRELVLKIVENIHARGALPVIVGGSGFYIKSLFFPPLKLEQTLLQKQELDAQVLEQAGKQELWEELYTLDQKRAEELEKNDNYRILRALNIIEQGVRASDCKPQYVSLGEYIDTQVIFCNRVREELKERITIRTKQMLQEGWLEEVETLLESPQGQVWREFLAHKKFIGYNECIAYLVAKKNNKELESVQALVMLEQVIRNKTWQYAKRQITLAKTVERQLNMWFTYPSCAYSIVLNTHDRTKEHIETIKRFVKST